MVPYRVLAQNLNKSFGFSLEETLASLSATIRVIAHELTADEAVALRSNIAPELRQVVTSARSAGQHDGAEAIRLVAAELEVTPAEAQSRMLVVLSALRTGDEQDAWGDLRFAQLLDRVRDELAGAVVEQAVA